MHRNLSLKTRDYSIDVNQDSKNNNPCINQLVFITHENYSAFDCNPSLEIRVLFLHLPKAFDKIWHDGLIY